jgi:ribosome-binding ATPase YchF (GTP1/OBG family)
MVVVDSVDVVWGTEEVDDSTVVDTSVVVVDSSVVVVDSSVVVVDTAGLVVNASSGTISH